jgi:hypothetical protein
VVSGGYFRDGYGSSSNTVTILAGGRLSAPSGLYIGAGVATGNVMVVNGGVITNVGDLYVGKDVGGFGNTLVVSNAGRVFSSTLNVGGAGYGSNVAQLGGLGSQSSVTFTALWQSVLMGYQGAGNNTLTLTNVLMSTTSGDLWLGRSTSNNTVNVLSSATWNLSGKNLVIGLVDAAGGATGNVFRVDAGMVINVGVVTIGSGKAGSPNTNALGNALVLNGGQFYASKVVVGNLAGDSNNVLRVGGGRLVVSNLTVAVDNALTINAGTLNTESTTINSGSCVVGDGTQAASLELAAGGTGFHSFSGSGLTITNAATLSGVGTITGNVTILGTLSPGFSVGTITTSNSVVLGASAV